MTRGSPLTRVLTLLELLQSHGSLTGTDLADRLGTDVRTVRRYVAHLRELGIPVQAERGRYGGYHLARGYRMPPLVLTNDEARAVVLGLLAAQLVGMGTATPASAGAPAKIERVLPHALREPLTAIQQTLSFTDKPVTAVLLALAHASHATPDAVDLRRPRAFRFLRQPPGVSLSAPWRWRVRPACRAALKTYGKFSQTAGSRPCHVPAGA